MQLNSVNVIITLERPGVLFAHLLGLETMQLVINGERITDSVTMANKFNNYFTGIAQALAENFLILQPPLKLYTPLPKFFGLGKTLKRRLHSLLIN